MRRSNIFCSAIASCNRERHFQIRTVKVAVRKTKEIRWEVVRLRGQGRISRHRAGEGQRSRAKSCGEGIFASGRRGTAPDNSARLILPRVVFPDDQDAVAEREALVRPILHRCIKGGMRNGYVGGRRNGPAHVLTIRRPQLHA